MVPVGVGHDHHVYILGLEAVGFQVVQQLAPGRFGALLGSQPGVDGDGMAVRLD